jgi:formylglycine-generating enzyme required for sulfatase activity
MGLLPSTPPCDTTGADPDGSSVVFGHARFAALALLACSIAVFSSCTPSRRGEIRENPKDGLRYVFVASGSFEDGCSKSDSDCKPDEKPTHTVTLSKGFWIGQTEVTVGSYRRFANETHRPMPPEPTFGYHNLNAGWADSQMPIVNVDWNDANAYCGWLGGHLPTEAQWEYAARGGTTSSQYDSLPRIAWIGDNSGKRHIDAAKVAGEDQAGYLGHLSLNSNAPHHVGMLSPNGYGVYDMLGNVWEWIDDWYGENYYKAGVRFDPAGQSNGTERVLRGASWVDLPVAARASVRGHRNPTMRSVDTGFRCVQ